MSDCNDKRCPVHGEISVRGNVLKGVVVSAKPDKTVVIERSIVRYMPKYERYKKEKSKIYAHNPPCIAAKENDIVRVGETRKLSKTKSFVVLGIIGKKKVIKAEEEIAADKGKGRLPKSGVEEIAEEVEEEAGKMLEGIGKKAAKGKKTNGGAAE